MVIGLDSGDAGPELVHVSQATGGTTHQLSSDSREVAQAILESTEQLTTSVDVQLVPVADIYDFVDRIEPAEVLDVEAGDELEFTVYFTGRVARGVEDREYRFNLELRARGVAVVVQIPVVVVVPAR